MENLLLTVLALSTAALLVSRIRQRRLLRALEASVKERRHFLAEVATSRQRRIGIDGLIREVNSLVGEINERSREQSGYLQQVEATFGAVQEAVFILDDRRTIVFANELARRHFGTERDLRGARLESVVRSPSLLEYLDSGAVEGQGEEPPQELSFAGPSGERWFEASRASLEDLPIAQGRATLLVLHDITRLKRLEVIRRDFVANVSHELRTPLTIIKGFAETLAEDDKTLSSESRARFLEKIANNAQRLHLLMEDLLTLSRLESKPEQFNPTVGSLRSLLNESCEIYRTRLKNPVAQEIRLEFDERVGDFAFDRFRLNQVIDNLMENVFRYAPDFTDLVVRAVYRGEDNRVVCSVGDDGPGIPEKDVPHVFERFYRVDKGRSRARGGTGLGLSIAKHIVQLHGGEVRAESAEGEGTTIFFELPYHKGVVQDEEPTAAEPEPVAAAEEFRR